MEVYLETARLVLRRFTTADVEHLVALDLTGDDFAYAQERDDWEGHVAAGAVERS
jgi:hypothetical protein